MRMQRALDFLLCLCVFSLLLACTENPGVETGNPQIPTRKVTGLFDDTATNPALNKKFLYSEYPPECEDPSEIEARPLDYSETITADVIDHTFEISVDPEKSYTFVTKQNDTYCGILAYSPLTQDVCADPYRVVIAAGDEDIDFGLLNISSYGSFEVQTHPAITNDRDGDGAVDAYDSDANNDGIEDFDGNFDGLVDFENVSDGTSLGVCDISSLESSGTSLIGTLVDTGGTQEIMGTVSDSIDAIDSSGWYLYDVDTGETLDFTDSVAGIEFADAAFSLSLALASDHDYVLTIPEGSVTCAGDLTLSREVSYYFRVVEFGVDYACGSSD